MSLLAMSDGQLAVWVILGYFAVLLALGLASTVFSRGTAADYFVASRGIGPIFLVLTIFGTTMTAFAMVGSSSEAFQGGVGVYGKMVSWSGIIHSLCFFLIGIKLWAFGKRYGYVTQIQFFRDRFESDKIGLVLFPALVGLVIPYVLVGIIGGGKSIEAVTGGAFPSVFPNDDPRLNGSIPFGLATAVICAVVMVYVFFGGVRGTTWANALQTVVFLVLGVVAFFVVADKLGGVQKATEMVAEYNPARLKVGMDESDQLNYEEKLAAFEAKQAPIKPRKPNEIPPLVFLSYVFIPLSVAMFPHLFQHWLTARKAKSFKLSVVAHPLLMMMVWVPCVLIGVWATSAVFDGKSVIPPDFNNGSAVLALMVRKLSDGGMSALLTAGILAAIMSSLDSQFLCISSIFSNDIVSHYISRDRLSDKARVMYGRIFVVLIVMITYFSALALKDKSVFVLGVWCFTGFASLSPLVFAAVYWRRATKAGAYACVLTVIALWILFFFDSQYNWGLADILPHTGKVPGERDYLVFGMMPVATMIAASTLALVVVSLLTPPPSQATVDKFFRPILPNLGAAAEPETATA